MSKSILVLEENPEIQGLIASSLNWDQLRVHQESDPEEFVSRAKRLKPDLIFISNSDQHRDYQTCREIRGDEQLDKIPLVLLANSRDELDTETLRSLGIDGDLRKPFDASRFQDQVRRHLSIENVPIYREMDDEAVRDFDVFDAYDADLILFVTNAAETGNSRVKVSGGMGNSLMTAAGRRNRMKEEEKMNVKSKTSMNDNTLLENDQADGGSSEMNSLSLDDDLFEFSDSLEPLGEDELKLDEGEPASFDPQTGNSVNSEPEPAGTKKPRIPIKDTGLEDSLAQNHVNENDEDFTIEFADTKEGFNEIELETPSFEAEFQNDELVPAEEAARRAADDEDPPQSLREGLTDIDLAVNNFEDPEELWKNPPDLNQIPRDNLADIKLTTNDFEPELPKNLKPLGEPVSQSSPQPAAPADGEVLSAMGEMDDFVLEASLQDEFHPVSNELDQIVLTEQGVHKTGSEYESVDLDEFMLESTEGELPEALKFSGIEEETLVIEDDSSEDDPYEMLDELEALNKEMAALEETEEELYKEAGMSESEEEELSESWEDAEDEIRDFVLGELEGYLEDEEDEEIAPVAAPAVEAVPPAEAVQTVAPVEEVFDDWESAEDAIMNFDRFSNEDTDVFQSVSESMPQVEEPMVEPAPVSSIAAEEAFGGWENAAEDAFPEFEAKTEMIEETLAEQEALLPVEEEPAEPVADFETAQLEELVAQSVEKALRDSIPVLVQQVMDELKTAQQSQAL